jgi:hypothetical protein
VSYNSTRDDVDEVIIALKDFMGKVLVEFTEVKNKISKLGK